MFERRDVIDFGRRLRDLRKERGQKFEKKYSYCKSQQAFCDEIASHEATDKSIRRQTLASWENGKSYPDISRLLILCELLDCEPNYLLGYSKVVNQDVKTVSEFTGLALQSVEVLKGNELLVNFLNYLLLGPNKKFIDLIDFIMKEYNYYYLEYDLLGHYGTILKKKMESAFLRSLSIASAYDDPLIIYKRELEKETRDLHGADGDNSILKYVNEDVQEQIRQVKGERHIPDDSEESYSLILDFLVDFSYQPLLHKNKKEQNLGRILQIFADLVEGFFDNERPKTQKDIKAYATARSQELDKKQ